MTGPTAHPLSQLASEVGECAHERSECGWESSSSSYREAVLRETVYSENVHWINVWMGIMVNCNVNLPQVRVTWVVILTWGRVLTALTNVGRPTLDVRGLLVTVHIKWVRQKEDCSSLPHLASFSLPRILSWYKSMFSGFQVDKGPVAL